MDHLVVIRLQSVQCTPDPNALNPCEDIMGFIWLRNSVWFVVILAVVGNVAVVVVIWFSSTEVRWPTGIGAIIGNW